MLCHRKREIFIVAHSIYFLLELQMQKILRMVYNQGFLNFLQFFLILSTYQLPDPTIQTLVFDISLRINLQHCRAKLNEKRPKRSSLLIVNELKFFFLCKKIDCCDLCQGAWKHIDKKEAFNYVIVDFNYVFVN